ncbi:hypothetical protein Ait01nite_016020 [Actinoplanes italicus]|uniref:hypothetical protein n=1 Tax=Actinoplanes italicus TaxID=113567 RepID=UPI0019429930|nr:hypothetical protein [Actinoplanes italicus]GIE28557.1 hypothetical protein Ait01nite_016020 [Actinoplanes italicus]
MNLPADLDDAGEVQVTDGHAKFIIAVRGGATRTARQLVAALRHARRLPLDNPQVQHPPPLISPTRPWRLHLAVAGLSFVIIALSLMM